MRKLPESDWKTFKKIRDELYKNLCARINNDSLEILNNKEMPESDKLAQLTKHIKFSTEVINACFCDFKRSSLPLRLAALKTHKILTDDYLNRFSDDTKNFLKDLEDAELVIKPRINKN